MRTTSIMERVSAAPAILARPRVLPTLIGLNVWICAHVAALVMFREQFAVLSWCTYAIALAFFHLSEFIWAAFFEPHKAGFDSFLLNQNWPDYQRAMAAAVIEFTVEVYFGAAWKGGWWLPRYVHYAGLACVVVGQAVRIAGMWTAGASFTHKIADVRRQEHTLVTGGIFKHLRHPSYFGWFYWATGTQLLLVNPVCGVLYAYVAWRFFVERIPVEEAYLREFFGPAYSAYARRTPIGIPGVRGLEDGVAPVQPQLRRSLSQKTEE